MISYIRPLSEDQIAGISESLAARGWIGGVVHTSGNITAHTQNDPMRVLVGRYDDLRNLASVEDAYADAAKQEAA